MACGLFMIDNEQNNIYKMDSKKRINLTKIDKYLKVKRQHLLDHTVIDLVPLLKGKKTTFVRSYNDRPCHSTVRSTNMSRIVQNI